MSILNTQCIIKECTEPATGVVVVNDNTSGMTMFMIPACDVHGQKMKVEKFTITLHGNEQSSVNFRHGEPADVTLTWEVM